MNMTQEQFEQVLRIATEEATDLCLSQRPERNDDSGWDRWHDDHFDRVLTYIDTQTDLGFIEAAEISEVCQEVESDIRHGNILGL